MSKHWLASLALLVVGSACANLVGIEKATLDPEASTGGAASASGGSKSVAGAANASGGAAAASGGAGNLMEAKRLACEAMCKETQETCIGPNSVYSSPEVCLSVCATFDLGKPMDNTGNSVACRLNNVKAGKANGERSFHCPAAGPGGNGVCGTDCASYCDLMSAICPDIFTSRVGCAMECAGLPRAPLPFNVSQAGGNTLECRLYHVSAATTDAQFHCPHAGGANPCIDK